MSAGKLFRNALEKEFPLQIVGTINAYCALLAKQASFRAIYLSGAGVANASFGMPDLGITTLNDVLEDVRRITRCSDLPLLVDIDTGWGGAFNIERTIKEMIAAGAAAIHIEDQVQAKRCGHRPNKKIVTVYEMVDRLKAAVDARTDANFFIMARTDALANEGLSAALDRIDAYIAAGADAIFFEGVQDLSEYQALTKVCRVPVLANITEFGKTPLFNKQQLAQVGVRMILYPLSAFRAMSQSALNTYTSIRDQGSQQSVISCMQTRQDLYDVLNYQSYESKLDELFSQGKEL